MEETKEQAWNIEKKTDSDPEYPGSDHQEHQVDVNAGKTKETEIPPLTAEEELKLKYDGLYDKYLRLFSEFENFKKRNVKERIELFRTAGENIITALLPSLDDFDRVSNNESDDIKVLKEAVKLIHNKFKNTLVQKGLEDMDSMKKTFDADLHEAVTNVPSPSKKLKGKVLEVVEKGYLLNGKIIRHAKVVVGN